MFRQKLPLLIQDYLTILLGYIYVLTCQFCLLDFNCEVRLSQDTQTLLRDYYKIKNSTEQKALMDFNSKISSRESEFNESANSENDKFNQFVKDTLNNLGWYRFYKSL